MANKKVSQLLSKPSVLVTDLFPIADPTTGQLFKTTISDLGTAIGSGVSSVNTLVGAVVLDTDDIQELASPTNRWFTDTRARAAISAGTGISYNSGTGVITNAVTSGLIVTALGYTPADDALVVKLAGSQTITGTKTFEQAPLMDIGVGYKNGSGVYNYLKSINTGWEMPVNGQNHNLIFSTSTNYVYTFPNASGTIALTSDLSAYVPYTGATGAVNLGAFDLTVNSIKVGRGGGNIFDNTILGNLALASNTTGSGNVAIGYAALSGNTIAGANTAIGYHALVFNTTGNNNTSIGYGSLSTNTTGSLNTAIGQGALASNTTGQSNVAIGLAALLYNTTASNNTAIGFQSLFYNTTGYGNVSIGVNSLLENTTGRSNTAIGKSAGQYITTGIFNTIVGSYGGTPTMSNNVILSDGFGNIRFQFDGTNTIIGQSGSVILTGALSGTSASFSGAVTSTLAYSNTSDLSFVATSNIPGYNLRSSAGGRLSIVTGYIGADISSILVGTGTNNPTTEALRFVHSTGAATFSASVTATTNLSVLASSNAGGNIKVFTSSSVPTQGSAFILAPFGNAILSHNILFDGSGYVYDQNGFGTSIRLSSGNANPGDIYFNTFTSGTAGASATENNKMIIKQNGNVGIGTTAPNSGLHISSGATRGLRIDVNSGVAGFSMSPNGVFGIDEPGVGNGRFVIDTNGRVGIGTTAPNGKLNVSNGGAEGIEFWVISATDTNLIQSYNRSTSAWNSLEYKAANHIFYGSGSERMRVTSAGTLGINTTYSNPVYKLVARTGTDANIAFGIQSGEASIESFNDAVNAGRPLRIYGDNLQYYTAGSERMRITAGGNLLVGTTTDVGQKFVVNGGIATIDNYLTMRSTINSTNYGFINEGNGLVKLAIIGVTNVGQFSMSTGIYTSTSDRNKKKDFEHSTIGLNEVMQLKPTLYRMKTESKDAEKQLGFIAQEVKGIIPSAYQESGDFIGLNFNPIVAALTKAVQELKAELDTLKNK